MPVCKCAGELECKELCKYERVCVSMHVQVQMYVCESECVPVYECLV